MICETVAPPRLINAKTLSGKAWNSIPNHTVRIRSCPPKKMNFSLHFIKFMLTTDRPSFHTPLNNKAQTQILNIFANKSIRVRAGWSPGQSLSRFWPDSELRSHSSQIGSLSKVHSGAVSLIRVISSGAVWTLPFSGCYPVDPQSSHSAPDHCANHLSSVASSSRRLIVSAWRHRMEKPSGEAAWRSR